ncbi:HD domain-containing phosphohydrolase [Actinotalea sp. K2]|uniref:HD domain-containing phosphohydrolase n=1 Tax=Actinotalea sp. K2 TaxID=2939438 RepID=UPI002017857E|nr:HD domain-containing phosphohydrolase [Actinotalea sp. K2]MCL3861131.1 LuxR C-terminal-related transcriptional regulator [Actinotalea sp. K2]
MFRLLELLGGLSVATDLGTGAPPEESLTRALVATRLARAAGCDEAVISDVIYTSLLQHLGCTAYSHESAALWGDDVAVVRLAFLTDLTASTQVWRRWVPGVAEATGTSRLRVLATTLSAGRKVDLEGARATCEVARDASRQLGLPPTVQEGLLHTMTMWNGKGFPPSRGTDIPTSTRVMQVAAVAVLFALHADQDEAVAQVRHRAGEYLDPDLADVFLRRPREMLEGLDEVDAYRSVLDSEPDPVPFVDDAETEAVARTFGHLVDLKSPWLHGHSAGVAELAATAAHAMGLDDQVSTVRIAGHLHDLGRIGVSSRIWDKATPSQTERDQARLHPYYSERILARIPALADAARLAGQHHERCDGSGYHRGLGAAQLTLASRVLGVADAYRCLVEGRPDQPALDGDRAAERITDEARAGGLDGDAVAGVLSAVGRGRGGRRALPGGLTSRQVEVLRLVSAGMSNREIADRLTISPRTAEHHVQDIYTRIGVASRAGAALFAMEHGLVDKHW